MLLENSKETCFSRNADIRTKERPVWLRTVTRTLIRTQDGTKKHLDWREVAD